MRAGALYRLDAGASPQFAVNPILFRVIRLHDYPTYDGWAWLDGYELDDAGDAVERRSVFVRIDGLVQRAAAAGPIRGGRAREALVRAVA